MKKLLKKLTKEDLIKVVANMHDTIQEWDNGYGLPQEDAECLVEIGSACAEYCTKNDWDLPNVIKKQTLQNLIDDWVSSGKYIENGLNLEHDKIIEIEDILYVGA